MQHTSQALHGHFSLHLCYKRDTRWKVAVRITHGWKFVLRNKCGFFFLKVFLPRLPSAWHNVIVLLIKYIFFPLRLLDSLHLHYAFAWPLSPWTTVHMPTVFGTVQQLQSGWPSTQNETLIPISLRCFLQRVESKRVRIHPFSEVKFYTGNPRLWGISIDVSRSSSFRSRIVAIVLHPGCSTQTPQNAAEIFALVWTGLTRLTVSRCV